MFLWLSILILLITFLISVIFIDKKNPLMLYTFVWLLVIVLYKLQLFGIYLISENTTFIIFISIFMFIIGYFLTEFIYKPKMKTETLKINSTNIKYLILIIILISLPFYIDQLQSLINTGFQIMANKILLATNEIDNGGVIMQYIVRPFEYIIPVISMYYVFNVRTDKFIIISGLYFPLIKFVLTGSKSIIIFYIIVAVIFYLNEKSNVLEEAVNRRKLKKTIITVGTLIVAFMVCFGNFIKSIYFYLCGCIPMLDKVVNSDFYMYSTNTYGFLSFNGVIRFIIKLLSIFGISINSPTFDLANNYILKFEYTNYVAPNYSYNAFMTYISNFYMDFGLIGVIILSFVFGILSCYIYKRFKCNKSIQNYALLGLLYYFILFSMVRFQLSNTILALAFIYSIMFLPIICYSKIKIRI